MAIAFHNMQTSNFLTDDRIWMCVKIGSKTFVSLIKMPLKTGVRTSFLLLVLENVNQCALHAVWDTFERCEKHFPGKTKVQKHTKFDSQFHLNHTDCPAVFTHGTITCSGSFLYYFCIHPLRVSLFCLGFHKLAPGIYTLLALPSQCDVTGDHFSPAAIAPHSLFCFRPLGLP